MNVLRQFIREVISEQALTPAAEESAEAFSLPQGEWVSVETGDPMRRVIAGELFDMLQATYASIGGHFKVRSPKDLERYKYWVIADIDEDDQPDVALFAKPDVGGTKMGGAANDGTPAAANAYKDKSSELRAGGAIGSGANWWGEVSGKPAYAMLKRGAPAVEDEAKVMQLLDGDDIIWHGTHPDPKAPALFKSVNGWYTKKFGSKESTKVILGSPAL